MPNTGEFQGEEGEGFFRDKLHVSMPDLVEVYVSDAFGSWQPHVSNYDVTKYIPAYAGFLMQEEIISLNSVINAEKPFLAVIAGSKYDTKIGPITKIYDKADHLILGGVLYNAYLCAKYGISIKGVTKDDIKAASELANKDRDQQKILEMPHIVESDTLDGKFEGQYRTISLSDFKEGNEYGYILDIDPRSFEDQKVLDAILCAKTVFVNAVMGFTPNFPEGTRALNETIAKNNPGLKMFGGGDTLQEFKTLCPGLCLSAFNNEKYYFFTGGGTVLKAIEQGSPYGLKPIQALMENKERSGVI